MDLPEHLMIQKSRTYRPIPAVLGAEGEWEGGAIVREIAGPLGLLLFGTIRDVMLWLLLSPVNRHEAFHTSAEGVRQAQLTDTEVPPVLRAHLAALAGMCGNQIDVEEVAISCLALAEWARENGALHSELAFRQAAALAQPTCLTHSLATARLARDLSQLRRAETWFRRTIKLARQVKDWETYIRAYLGLGTMYNRMGNGPAARAVMGRALTAATRWRLRQLAGEAHHDLFHVWADLGDLRRAYEHASSARSCYAGAQHHLYRLAADLGILSIKVGAPERAIRLFQVVIPHFSDPNIIAVLLAHLTRAAAESHNRSLYEATRGDFESAAGIGDRWRKAESHAIIARAHIAMLEWELARAEAVLASNLARQISAVEIQEEAEAILALIASAKNEPCLRKPETPGIARMADGLAAKLREAVSI